MAIAVPVSRRQAVAAEQDSYAFVKPLLTGTGRAALGCSAYSLMCSIFASEVCCIMNGL